MASVSNDGRDRSPRAVPAPHWDNSQPLGNWYRDQIAKIGELHHPCHAQLQRARVPTLVKALQELGFDNSHAENEGGHAQQHGEQSVSAQVPPETLAPTTEQPQQKPQQQPPPQRWTPNDQTPPEMGQNGGPTNELDAKI